MNKPAALSDWLWQWEWGHPWHSTSFHCYFLYGGASCRFLANTFSSVLSAQKITSLQAFTAFSVSVTHIHTLAISTPFDLNTLNCGTLESLSTIKGGRGRMTQWLERRTRDWKVAGSNGAAGEVFFSRVDFLCRTLISVSVSPCVTAVARKGPRSFCQKCRLIDWWYAYIALFSVLLSRLTALACGSTWVTSFILYSAFLLLFWISTEVVYLSAGMAGATWNCSRLGASPVYTIQPCTMSLHAKPHT